MKQNQQQQGADESRGKFPDLRVGKPRMTPPSPIRRYFDLVSRIDAEARRLTALHGDGITCGPGCADCCVNLSVFPVEFYAIRQAMAQAGIRPAALTFDPAAPCGFLRGGRCRIYPFRPVICRTHGLPILFLDDASGGYAWEVSFCERNFTGRPSVEFTGETLLDIEAVNMDLSRINRDFSESMGWSGEKGLARIPLGELVESA